MCDKERLILRRFFITATPSAGNSTPATFELANDEVGPTVLIDVPPTSGLGVPVSWEGLDLGAGIRGYEVHNSNYKDWG